MEREEEWEDDDFDAVSRSIRKEGKLQIIVACPTLHGYRGSVRLSVGDVQVITVAAERSWGQSIVRYVVMV